jgi:uncharacterized protein involved in exopolysaccharide biosynthesis
MATSAELQPTIAKLKEYRAVLERQLVALDADKNDLTVQRCNTPSTGFLVQEFERLVKAIDASLRRFGA